MILESLSDDRKSPDLKKSWKKFLKLMEFKGVKNNDCKKIYYLYIQQIEEN